MSGSTSAKCAERSVFQRLEAATLVPVFPPETLKFLSWGIIPGWESFLTVVGIHCTILWRECWAEWDWVVGYVAISLPT